MKTSILARSLFAGLVLIATPLYGQDVSGEVVVRSGPVAGRVVIGDEYSSYRRPAQRGRVERHAPRIIRVERLRHHHEKHWKRGKHWKHTGYRAVIVYYVDGRYYDRADRYHPRVHEVVVYERDGRYYRDECPDRYDDD